MLKVASCLPSHPLEKLVAATRNAFFFLLDYRRTTAGKRCHCDLVPSVLLEFLEQGAKNIALNVSENRKGRERITSAWLADTGHLGASSCYSFS